MKTKILGILAIISIATLLFSVYQPTDAVSYYNHDGSIDENLSKVKVQKMKNKGNLWTYIVKACADNHTIGVAAVILKSDMDERVLEVSKNIKKGDCSYYGAIMNAKNGETLGAELIEKHEALTKYNEILNNMENNSSKNDKKKALSELIFYRNMLRGIIN